jgi:hypothetical protein
VPRTLPQDCTSLPRREGAHQQALHLERKWLAGGVYQWERIEYAKAFYGGPWLDGIVQRYGMMPQIEFYEVFAVTDIARGKVDLLEEAVDTK